MATEYTLPFTGEQIEEKLEKIDKLSEEIVDLKENGLSDSNIGNYIYCIDEEKSGLVEMESHLPPFTNVEYQIAYNNGVILNGIFKEAYEKGYRNIVFPYAKKYPLCYQNNDSERKYAYGNETRNYLIKMFDHTTYDFNFSELFIIYDSDNKSPYDISSNDAYKFNSSVFYSQSYLDAKIKNGILTGTRFLRSYVNSNEKLTENERIFDSSYQACGTVFENMTVQSWCGDWTLSATWGRKNLLFNNQQFFSKGFINGTSGELVTNTVKTWVNNFYTDLLDISEISNNFCKIWTGVGYNYMIPTKTSLVVSLYDKDSNFTRQIFTKQCYPFWVNENECYIRISFVSDKTEDFTYPIRISTLDSGDGILFNNCTVKYMFKGCHSNFANITELNNCTYLYNAVPVNGYEPYSGATKYFVDIEDVQTPLFKMKGCVLEECVTGILFGGIDCIIDGNRFNLSGSTSCPICLYRGRDIVFTNNVCFSKTLPHFANEESYKYMKVNMAGNVFEVNDERSLNDANKYLYRVPNWFDGVLNVKGMNNLVNIDTYNPIRLNFEYLTPLNGYFTNPRLIGAFSGQAVINNQITLDLESNEFTKDLIVNGDGAVNLKSVYNSLIRTNLKLNPNTSWNINESIIEPSTTTTVGVYVASSLTNINIFAKDTTFNIDNFDFIKVNANSNASDGIGYVLIFQNCTFNIKGLTANKKLISFDNDALSYGYVNDSIVAFENCKFVNDSDDYIYDLTLANSLPSYFDDCTFEGLIKDAPYNYTITNELTNVTNNNTLTNIVENSSYTANLTIGSDYLFGKVIVTMGGVDITNSVYSDGVINIPHVTGDIVIVAKAVLEVACETVETLPSWISEMQVVTYNPRGDTNESKTFAINMENEPNMMFITSDFETNESYRDFVGGQVIKAPSSGKIGTILYHSTTTAILSLSNINYDGISLDGNSNVVITPHVLNTENCYWRKGHEYKIYCMKTKTDASSLDVIPSFANEMVAIEYIPEEDTNTLQTFNYEMENEPNCVMILSDITEKENNYDVVSVMASKLYDVTSYTTITTITNNTEVVNVLGDSGKGVVSTENGTMTYAPYVYGGNTVNFRAGHKYVVLLLNM